MIERQKPIKHEEIAITPVELQVTSKGDQFLAGNSGPDGKTVITFVSGDDQALTRREGIKPGMACKRDFQNFHHLLHQNYSVYAFHNDHTVPLVYTLLMTHQISDNSYSHIRRMRWMAINGRVFTRSENTAIDNHSPHSPNMWIRVITDLKLTINEVAIWNPFFMLGQIWKEPVVRRRASRKELKRVSYTLQCQLTVPYRAWQLKIGK